MSKFLIVFVLTYAGGLVATLLLEASWGIYLYEVEYFLNPPIRWWYGSLPELRYSLIIAVCILVSYLIRKQNYSGNRLFDVPQTKWLLMMSIMMIIISFYAVWPEMHSKTLRTYLKLMVFLAISYKVIDTPKKFERLIWAFLIGSFYLGWVAHSTGRTMGGRLEGIGPSDTGGDSNPTAANLIAAVPILLFYLIKGKTWQRLLSLLFLAYIVDGIILINSRGAFVGLVVSCSYLVAVYVFFNKNVTINERVKIMGVILIGVCMFIYLTDVTFWERMMTITEQAEAGDSGLGRIFFWMKTFDMVKQHPFGVGVWGYQYLSPQFIPEAMLAGGKGMRAVHSTYFQVLAEYGYLGVPIFAGLILSTFRLMRKTKHYLRDKGELYLYYQGIALESGFIAFLTASAFIDRLQAEILHWFILFIACFGNIYLLKNHDTEKVKVAVSK